MPQDEKTERIQAVTVCMTETDKEKLMSEAKRKSMSFSAYVRMLIGLDREHRYERLRKGEEDP